MKAEVVIVGGGASGGAMACALSQCEYFQRESAGNNPYKLILLDSSRLPSMEEYRVKSDSEIICQRVPEPRVVTLSPSSMRLLRSMGIINIAEGKCITPFHSMIVYEQSGSSSLKFNNTANKNSGMVKIQEQLIKQYLQQRSGGSMKLAAFEEN